MASTITDDSINLDRARDMAWKLQELVVQMHEGIVRKPFVWAGVVKELSTALGTPDRMSLELHAQAVEDTSPYIHWPARPGRS